MRQRKRARYTLSTQQHRTHHAGDGTSYTGGVYETKPLNATASVTYRGRWIRDALVATLAKDFGLGAATDVAIGGCSAGGLTIYLNIDYLAGLVAAAAPQAKVHALADAGWFLDHPDINGLFSSAPAKKSAARTEALHPTPDTHTLKSNQQGTRSGPRCFSGDSKPGTPRPRCRPRASPFVRVAHAPLLPRALTPLTPAAPPRSTHTHTHTQTPRSPGNAFLRSTRRSSLQRPPSS
jgi:hypothetical protein